MKSPGLWRKDGLTGTPSGRSARKGEGGGASRGNRVKRRKAIVMRDALVPGLWVGR